MSAVLTASITQLCAQDHRDDPDHIVHWTRNKSADGVRAMLENPELTLLVAELGGTIAGVAGYQGDALMLNYVSPATALPGSRTIIKLSSATAPAAYE